MRFSSLFVASLMCGLSSTAMSQTDATISLPTVVVGAPKQVAKPQKPQQQAVAHSGSPETPIITASVAPVYGRDTLVTTTGNCSTTTWPSVSPVQCTKPFARNYVECTEMISKRGGRTSDSWWWCGNQGFKN